MAAIEESVLTRSSRRSRHSKILSARCASRGRPSSRSAATKSRSNPEFTTAVVTDDDATEKNDASSLCSALSISFSAEPRSATPACDPQTRRTSSMIPIRME
eukprot:Amastigsp_a861253_2.p3 type:complete len:102 gc:universal Amastigsp_a861253_2:135-440(+)